MSREDRGIRGSFDDQNTGALEKERVQLAAVISDRVVGGGGVLVMITHNTLLT